VTSSTAPPRRSSAAMLITRSRNAGALTASSSERTMISSSKGSRPGNLSSISSSACFDSGLLVTSPSLDRADPRKLPISAKPMSTSPPQMTSIRRGLAVAISASRRGLRPIVPRREPSQAFCRVPKVNTVAASANHKHPTTRTATRENERITWSHFAPDEESRSDASQERRPRPVLPEVSGRGPLVV
jgi:hypothetical protein